MTKLQQAENRARVRYPDKVLSFNLPKQFIPAYESGDRITVSFCDSDGKEYERKRGTIGLSTGRSPVFLLMLTKRSIGSMYAISHQDKVV